MVQPDFEEDPIDLEWLLSGPWPVHPFTCNGGNDDWTTHHDHEVIMERTKEGGLVCPECGRVQ